MVGCVYLLLHSQSLRSSCYYSRGQIKESTKGGNGTYVTRGSGGMPPKCQPQQKYIAPKYFGCFRAVSEFLVQSEANNYSTYNNYSIASMALCCG